jgi:serine/threonine protein kinase
MPPEIMKAEKYEESADIYSYGMIVWEMMTGEIPYYGLTPNQIIGIVADCRKIVEIPKNANPYLKKIAKSCLIYDAIKRPNFHQIIKYLDEINKKSKSHDHISDEIVTFIN